MKESTMETRCKRVQDAISLREGDRVPFIPLMNNFYALHYGVSIQDAMTDVRTLIPAMTQYLKDYDPDLVYEPCYFPILPMETAAYANAKWPGEYYGLPEDTPYQYVDKTYLQDDEYETYLNDPGSFLVKNVLAGKYKNFAGLQMLNLESLCGPSILSLASLGLPPVQEALQAMMKAGQQVQEFLTRSMEVDMPILQAGYPLYGAATACMPFDDFADNVRGLLDTCMDLVTDPELVDEAVTRWGDAAIPAAVQLAQISHQKYAVMPLHCGTDDFMSLENYQKYYWPHLKRMILAYVEADITPIVICEGKYNSRLETLTDVPKGKVVYLFEDVDIRKAKKILGDYACIGGGFSTHLLMEGKKPEAVKDKVKELMDACAPGGGYIMTNSLALDYCAPELMHTWREAVDEFGTY